MDTLIHADIFFFVATIGFVIIGIGVVIALVFVIMILKSLHKLSETVRMEADHIAGDIDSLRARAGSWSWKVAFRLFKRFISSYRE